MDFGDKELKATRRINGSDKNVGSIEDIEGLKRLFYANALTQYGKRKIIEYYEQRIKELEEKWDKDTHKLQNALDLANADKINNYIHVSLVEEKIEELKEKIEQLRIERNVTYDSSIYRNQIKIDILQELLKGE